MPDIIDILLQAVPYVADWLKSTADIVLKATPLFGGLPPIMVLLGFAWILFMGWEYLNEGRMM